MTLRARRAPAAVRAAARDRFAADVHYYLALTPRQLPSQYLYDALGSALFEAICELPWYPLKRAEMRLLTAHAPEILNGGVSAIVELGSGSGEKLAAVAAAASHRRPVDVHLVDVSATALARAERTLARNGGVRVTAHETTYEAGLEEFGRARRGGGRSLAMFLGSNIGNFDPPGREAFLRAVRAALRGGDAFLIGADLIKVKRELLLAYDDPLGVTAAFNRNLLVRINRELGGAFDVDAFAHCAVWNGAHRRVEMHLVSTRAQHVVVRAAGLDVAIAAGESIWTESSYKFDAAEIASLLERCGFHVSGQWIDAAGKFALTHAEAV